ncbi:2-methylcitrate dehydratase PrpD [Cribrihabitans marinus]|uniref:2-methylcitrate dehydratase PrpD n=1 Tax=Cribrihabitans marinus TaxID=1227549 RepID=A0A1H6Y6D1_9RHOB|nr:MmgE/PrpD family protein [Cribrihabitans marinus]GGH28470.1 2-methylcitrate dehydratase [Cribrihabitans marinus]SEJ35464.1 2-methylcitrate dehydratase PrpD [Cribrihabitans marinus]
MDTGSRQTPFGRLAAFTLDTAPEAIPARTREFAALMMLDTLGVTIAAAPMQAGVIARETATLLFASAEKATQARMLFDGRAVGLAGAAYAAATQTDNLDAHDGYNPTKGHIGVVAVPALAALAEHAPGLSGQQALAALVICYEVAGRAGMALHGTVSDYHTSGAWNALGVAAMAARLRGHSPEQLRQALGIAEYHGPRSQMMREIANPTMLHDGSGWGALTGLSAAILAERGFTGAPAITVEGDAVAAYWQDLGRFWQMDHQYVKPYPICRWAHAAIDAVRQVMAEHDLPPERIRAVRIASFHQAVCLFPGLPDTTSQAQYSLPFAVAVQIVHGRIGVEHISGDGLRDARVAEMIRRITVSESPRHNWRFPEGRWADVVIETTDGQELASGDVHARGGPEAPMERDEVIGKYIDFAAPVLGATRAGAIRDATLRLVQPGSRFEDLAELIYAPSAPASG